MVELNHPLHHTIVVGFGLTLLFFSPIDPYTIDPYTLLILVLIGVSKQLSLIIKEDYSSQSASFPDKVLIADLRLLLSEVSPCPLG